MLPYVMPHLRRLFASLHHLGREMLGSIEMLGLPWPPAFIYELLLRILRMRRRCVVKQVLLPFNVHTRVHLHKGKHEYTWTKRDRQRDCVCV